MLKKIVTLALGTVYVVCLGEAFVRVFAPQPIVPRYVTGADYGVRTNIAGARYRHYTGDVNVEYRINNAGYRADVEYQREKPPGTCRVLMFGDSFMMGYEVAVEDSIPQVLQALLAKSGRPCDVINMGVSGFGTAEMLLALERNGLSYDPDIVVFQWHRSDFQDNVRSGLFELSSGELQRGQESYLPAAGVQDALQRIPVYTFLAQYSQLYSAARETLAAQAKSALVQLRRSERSAETPAPSDTEAPLSLEADADKPQGSYEARLGARLLQYSAQVARVNGARFFVLDISEEQKDGSVASSLSRMNPVDLSGLDIVILDEPLNALFRDGKQIFYQKGHGHFTPLGYAVAAQELYRAIIHGMPTASGTTSN